MSRKRNLSQEDKIKAINWWQSQEFLYPLTCINKNHDKLCARKKEQDIELYCKNCNYIQKNISESVYLLYLSRERFTGIWKQRKRNSSTSQK
jgi:hypothetical protein